jgi:hypothetical protein
VKIVGVTSTYMKIGIIHHGYVSPARKIVLTNGTIVHVPTVAHLCEFTVTGVTLQNFVDTVKKNVQPNGMR